MIIHVKPSTVSNILVQNNKCKERTEYDIDRNIIKVRLHHKFMKLFYSEKESYMICIGDVVSGNNSTVTVKSEQDLKNIIQLIRNNHICI